MASFFCSENDRNNEKTYRMLSDSTSDTLVIWPMTASLSQIYFLVAPICYRIRPLKNSYRYWCIELAQNNLETKKTSDSATTSRLNKPDAVSELYKAGYICIGNQLRYKPYWDSDDCILACADHSFYYFRYRKIKVASFFSVDIVRFFGRAILPSTA